MKNSFRTIEVSDKEFERDGLRWFTVKSENLKGRGDVVVYLPETKLAHPLPVIILLHGVYGSAWSWPFKSGVHLQVQDMILKKIIPPVMLVFPSDGLWGDGSGYVAHDGYNFEKWIAEDVPLLIQEQFMQITEKSKFFITGLSMGGFGAMKIGAKYPEIFSAFSGHSSITHLDQMELFVEEGMDYYSQQDVADSSVFETILLNQSTMRPFRFDCGKSDKLLSANRKLHNQLETAGILHDYNEYKGGHEWPYWKEHISKSILFFMNCPGS